MGRRRFFPLLSSACCVRLQVVGSKHVLEEFRVGVTAVMLAAKQDIQQGNLKHKDLTGQEVSSQVCTINRNTVAYHDTVTRPIGWTKGLVSMPW